MASTPLDTITEEPTAAPTPPNSPAATTTPARVTANPPQTKPAKNAGRVASGKGLPNATASQGRPRKRHKQRPPALRAQALV